MSWSPADIPDQSGRVAIVTGSNTGLGFETARHLAAKGAHVVVACRSPDKGAAAVARILEHTPDASIETLALDLSSLASVRAFADAFQAKHSRLDLLLNNAGIMMVPYGLTEDGFERQLGVNHLGHFALTLDLAALLQATEGSRVVNVASLAHNWGDVLVDDLHYQHGRGYSPREAYGQSKLSNLLFTTALDARLKGTRALAAHPGIAMTDLMREYEDKFYWPVAKPVMGLFLQSADMGAWPTLRAAVDPDAPGGAYFGPDGFRELGGAPIEVGRSKRAQDADLAERFWTASEHATGRSWPG
jgi:NAD(P)-dependent dehydrogenase (short-subunit alcohol dehydrogenase family)